MNGHSYIMVTIVGNTSTVKKITGANLVAAGASPCELTSQDVIIIFKTLCMVLETFSFSK
jgi:hypothetical protein